MVDQKEYERGIKIVSYVPDKGWVDADEIFEDITKTDTDYTYEMFIQTLRRLHSVHVLNYNSKQERPLIRLSMFKLVHRQMRREKKTNKTEGD